MRITLTALAILATLCAALYLGNVARGTGPASEVARHALVPALDPDPLAR